MRENCFSPIEKENISLVTQKFWHFWCEIQRENQYTTRATSKSVLIRGAHATSVHNYSHPNLPEGTENKLTIIPTRSCRGRRHEQHWSNHLEVPFIDLYLSSILMSRLSLRWVRSDRVKQDHPTSIVLRRCIYIYTKLNTINGALDIVSRTFQRMVNVFVLYTGIVLNAFDCRCFRHGITYTDEEISNRISRSVGQRGCL